MLVQAGTGVEYDPIRCKRITHPHQQDSLLSLWKSLFLNETLILPRGTKKGVMLSGSRENRRQGPPSVPSCARCVMLLRSLQRPDDRRLCQVVDVRKVGRWTYRSAIFQLQVEETVKKTWEG